MPLDETHAPSLRSWVESANVPGADFPIQNLPFGVFTTADDGRPRIGVAIGALVLDMRAASPQLSQGALSDDTVRALGSTDLNGLMSLGAGAATAVRQRVSRGLREGAPERPSIEPCLVPADRVRMQLPARIGDYTDFYASIHHATNVGGMFRPDEPLLENYKYVPIGYHGRSSSIVVSGTAVRRPSGQARAEHTAEPAFGPTRRLDYELELGLFVGAGNAQGEPVPLRDAESHLFGVCLVNDWSARDIQQWEYRPLGPFLGKSFATTISPWVVTIDALAPFRVPALRRPDGDPAPLPYLQDHGDPGEALDIRLEISIRTARMREAGHRPEVVARSTSKALYWTPAQLVTHHTSNGCNLRPGDLLASGTISGPTRDSRGCLLELAWRGTEPITLATGEQRRFLEDGDEVIFRGWCDRQGFARIGLGECRGRVTA